LTASLLASLINRTERKTEKLIRTRKKRSCSKETVRSTVSPSITPALFHFRSRLKTYLTNLSRHISSGLTTDYTDFMTGPFLLSISGICFWTTVSLQTGFPAALYYQTVICPVRLSVTLVYCGGQTVGWIKMKLGMQVGLVPGHCVRWDPAPPQRCKVSPNLRPMSVVAKRLDGSRSHKTCTAAPTFWPMSIVAKRPDGSRCHLVWRYRPRHWPNCV